jgi:Domain of unknown function (DUF4157)
MKAQTRVQTPATAAHTVTRTRVEEERPRRPSAASAIGQVLRAPGRPLDSVVRGEMESRFRYDFSRVRLHTDARASESARALKAAAYTVGRDVVLNRELYRPGTREGMLLLAHELSHVVQQRGVSERNAEISPKTAGADNAFERSARENSKLVAQGRPAGEMGPSLTRPALQTSAIGSFFSDFFSLSVGPFQAIARLFGSENYSDADLTAYLNKITKANKIEDRYDSDNKARAIVKRWMQNKKGFLPTATQRALLIREMLSGYTSGADERAILTILQHSDHAELEAIFRPGNIDPKKLDDSFSGDQAKELHAFFDLHFIGGTRTVRAGGNKLKPEVPAEVKPPYSWAQLKAVLDERITEIELTLLGLSEKERTAAGLDLARKDADYIYAQLQKLNPDERDQAIHDLAVERVHQDNLATDAKFKFDETNDAAVKETLRKRWRITTAASLMIDLSLEQVYKDIAMSAPGGEAAFRPLATPLKPAEPPKPEAPAKPAEEKKAQEALKPVTKQSVEAELSGKPAEEAPPKFQRRLDKEKETYEDKIRGRAPDLINEKYEQIAAPRTEKIHKDSSKVHQLSELEVIGNRSAEETNLVFGQFKKAPPFKADKFDAAGKLVSRGNIHDVWQSEQAQLKADPAYEKQSARFWMYYLLQNDSAIKAINYKHNASPEFDQAKKPLNDEAKSIGAVADKYIASDSKRLFEIGRGWPAFNQVGEVSIQLFKKPNEKEDRRFLWDMFFTLIHEYLHSLSDGKYSGFADKLGGEHSTEGNTLIEGVDSLLTETVWTHAKPRASLPENRQAVEPDAVKAGEPFDASLLPEMPHRRYDTYRNAIKLVSVVGIRNLYAAYFYGDIEFIGGKP